MTLQKEQQIKELIARISLSEEFVSSDNNYPSGKHVCLLFNDGELSSTKAGSLLHMRTLHCFHSGDETKTIPKEWFPQRMGSNAQYGFVYCTHENGKLLRELMLNEN